MSDALQIHGGKPLKGSVPISGSKNGALPILAASLLMTGEAHLTNVPRIADVETMLALLRHYGAQVTWSGPDAVTIDASSLQPAPLPVGLACKMRASYYVLGPLSGRLGEAAIPQPGGCNLGSRPVDYILNALKPLGLSAEDEDNCLIVKGGPARGGRVVLDPFYRSPGATFMAVMAACLGSGETVIEHACEEPDVINFCEFLTLAGAQLAGVGTPTIHVQGVKQLTGASHHVLGDRLEAGTYLLAGAASYGDVTALGIQKSHLCGFTEALEACGVQVVAEPNAVRAICTRRPRPLDIVTRPCPGFPTDLQPPMMAFLACADGTSHIEETIFDGRMGHVDQLRRMGADIDADDRTATLRGVPHLSGADVEALNIRAGATMLVAAVAAHGATTIGGLSHLARGYERIAEKLTALGAQVS